MIEKILKDKIILEKYEAIDKINPYPFNHGMTHIKNVFNLTYDIARLFNLTNRQLEMLQICEILHDLGQVDGREGHGLKASLFAKQYLQNKGLSNKEIIEIVSAISTHDEHLDYSKLKYDLSWYVNFIDKMDFSKYRLENNSLEKFGWIPYNDIERLDFVKKGNNLKIIIRKTKDSKLITKNLLLERNFFNKVILTIRKFCEHFNLKPQIWLESENLNLF